MLENKKEYVAQFTTSCQVGMYEWAVINPSMLITEDTKFSEIVEFYKKNDQSKTSLLDLRISELQ